MSGERAGDREALDRLTRDVLDQPKRDGSRFSPEDARRMARTALIDADRRLRDGGKR